MQQRDGISLGGFIVLDILVLWVDTTFVLVLAVAVAIVWLVLRYFNG